MNDLVRGVTAAEPEPGAAGPEPEPLLDPIAIVGGVVEGPGTLSFGAMLGSEGFVDDPEDQLSGKAGMKEDQEEDCFEDEGEVALDVDDEELKELPEDVTDASGDEVT